MAADLGMNPDFSIANSHCQNPSLHSNAEPLHAPAHSASTSSADAPHATPEYSELQLRKRALMSQDLQAFAALAGEDNINFREHMHLFIDHAMDLQSFAQAYPSFDSQTIRRVMHRVASRMPIVFRVADVLTHGQMGLPMLRWTPSSGRKYFLSDAVYNSLFDSERSKMLGQISSSKFAELIQAAERVSRQVELRPPDLFDASITSAQQELVSSIRNSLECEADHGKLASCAHDPAVDAEPPRSISLAHILISETCLLLEDIQQRRREWNEIYEETLDADRTLTFALAMQSSAEGATRLAKRDEERAQFLARAALQPPPVLRVIDLKSTCKAKKVVLRDYWDPEVQQVGFSAISHTYGMEVYDVFNCQCTTEFSSTAYVSPRCLVGPCPHDATVSQEGRETRDRVVNDILGMCENLGKAGAEYAWHDGVCIAQHDDAEVKATIKCMGWVYASAKETIIFLHYVGNPMAPVAPGNADHELTCRWHTRVWTLQEAALSNRRRYCVRVGSGPSGNCQSLEEFEKEIGLWYEDESSKVMVIEEDRYVSLLWQIYLVLYPLLANYAQTRSFMDLDIMDGLEMWRKGIKWSTCLYKLTSNMLVTCFTFPSAENAITMGAGRQSKHVGDHINSILALAGVRDFVAEKDEDMERSTIEFFKRQEQPAGLARALFSANVCQLDTDVEKHMREVRQHTWPPLLWKLVKIGDFAFGPNIQFRVQKDENLEVRAELLCVSVRFMAERGRLVIDRRKEMERFLQDEPKEFCLDASCSYLKMCIAPLPQLSRFRATAPENACCDLGNGNVLMYYESDEASSSGSRSGGGLKRIDQMRDGESFHAHLVLPMHHFRLAVEERKSVRLTLVKRNGYQCKALPVLVVQGKLDAPVSKIGCFDPTFVFVKTLEDILDNDPIQFPAFTFVDKIVIS